MALCVCRPGAASTEAEIREWANGQLSNTQRLVAVEFREQLPRSTIGKIMKRELREIVAAKVVAETTRQP